MLHAGAIDWQTCGRGILTWTRTQLRVGVIQAHSLTPNQMCLMGLAINVMNGQ